VIRDHDDDLEIELLAAGAPQQVEQAVIATADHDRHALGHAGVGERPAHVKRLRDLRGEPARERAPQPGPAGET